LYRIADGEDAVTDAAVEGRTDGGEGAPEPDLRGNQLVAMAAAVEVADVVAVRY
jgi:hypothetical protein